MATGTEKFNFKIDIQGKTKRKPCNLQPITMDKLVDYINSTITDERVKEEVKKMALKYPGQSLQHFYGNLKIHIAEAQKIVSNIPRKKKKKNLEDV